MKEEHKLDRISERVYNASFIMTVVLILFATIGTALVRYMGTNCITDSKNVLQCVNTNAGLILVPDNVFKFIEHVIYVFAIPQTVKLIGDKLPLIVQGIVALRGMQSGYGQNQYGMNQGYGDTGFGMNQGYGQTGMYPDNQNWNTNAYSPINGANPNTYY